MRKLLTCITLVALATGTTDSLAQRLLNKSIRSTNATTSANTKGSLWTNIPLSNAPAKELMRFHPSAYKVFKLNATAMRTQLWALTSNTGSTAIISLPMPDGSFRNFRVWESSVMPQEMAAKYPGIKTFSAEAVNDKRVTAKLDYTLFGFHAVIFDGEQTIMTDPYDNLNDDFYMVHYKQDENRPFSQRMKCAVGGAHEHSPIGEPMNLGKTSLPYMDLGKIKNTLPPATTSFVPGKTPLSAEEPQAITVNGATLRTYRLALSANSFYCQAATGLGSPTIAQCLSAMTTTLNRVNGVYNREISVQLVYCNNEDTLIWPTATGSINGADPFAGINTDPVACINQNQTTVTARIGSANYDVGHVFTTGAGGLAGLGVICNNTQKARGVTGAGTPVGDAFDIDYVAHELGHQFGSSHTFNNNVDGSCNGNASSANAYEPASGATIMDYAGICNPDNIQPNSSPYFSASSLTQIQAHISGSGGTCAVTAPSGHAPATMAPFTALYTIPYKTPFELTSPTATPSAGDTAVTYCWFQWNRGDFGSRLNQTFVRGPIFRSYQPVYNETRVFPRINTVLTGALTNSGEKAPDTTRYLTMKMAVRNIMNGMGCFSIYDDTVHIDAISTGSGNGYAGFRVTSQNTGGIIYTGGSTQTVTWNVVGTNAPPVSAANVTIYMSTDGGFTWPYTIGTFPNTGTASVTLPNPPVTTTTARIKVKGAGNIFFNINSNNFRVNPGPTTGPITGTLTLCVGGTTTLSDTTAGGTWTSSTPAVATIGSLTGIVTGIAAGTATITYNASSGNVTAVVTVNAIPAPAAITGSGSVCIGLTTSLSNATPGGVWSSSNTSIATVNTSGVVTGESAGTVVITYAVTNACGTGTATRTLTVSAPLAVAPVTGTLSLCSGATTTLSCATPSGTWSSTDAAIATVNTTGTVTGVSAGTATISYNVTNAFGCVSASSVIVTVNALPAVTTTPSGAVVICIGGSQLISATPSGAGFTYQWQDAGVDIAGATNSTYLATTSGTFRAVVTNTATGCTGSSAVVTVTTSASTVVVPAISIAATPGTTICATTGAVSYTATPVNEGATPIYQWFVNNIAVGGSTTTFSYTPANGDIVKCMLTSSLPCATPATVADSLTMTVSPAVTPDVSINATPNDTVCIGQPATYNAIPVNGGTAPTYQWARNGVNVATGPSYTHTPANGDIIVCQMVSNASCRTATVATSSPLIMTVQVPATNTVSISASSPSIIAGENITFVAVALNAGPSPDYQWFINSAAVPGATNATFTTNTLTNGQVVHCKVTSNLPCILPKTALSAGFTISVTSGVTDITGAGNTFAVHPNPNTGTFSVTGNLATSLNEPVQITVTNVLGQTLYSTVTTAQNGNVDQQISLPSAVPTGIYFITVHTGTEQIVFRVAIDK
jgi:uncharacterized protein YjdB